MNAEMMELESTVDLEDTLVMTFNGPEDDEDDFDDDFDLDDLDSVEGFDDFDDDEDF